MDGMLTIPQGGFHSYCKKKKRIAQNMVCHFTYSVILMSWKIRIQEEKSYYLESRDQILKVYSKF